MNLRYNPALSDSSICSLSPPLSYLLKTSPKTKFPPSIPGVHGGGGAGGQVGQTEDVHSAPVQLLALNPGINFHFALCPPHPPVTVSLHSIFNDCNCPSNRHTLFPPPTFPEKQMLFAQSLISFPLLLRSWRRMCRRGLLTAAQAGPSGSLFLSRDLPGQDVGCSFHAGGAALPPTPCSPVYVEYFLPRVLLFGVAGSRELSRRLSEEHLPPSRSALGGQ